MNLNRHSKKVSFTPDPYNAPRHNSQVEQKGSQYYFRQVQRRKTERQRKAMSNKKDFDKVTANLTEEIKIDSRNEHTSRGKSINQSNISHLSLALTKTPNLQRVNQKTAQKTLREPIRSFSTNYSNVITMLKEEKINLYTDSEIISDFYEYTEECWKIITTLPNKPEITKAQPVTLKFKDMTKKLAVFDWDETLIHCTGNITSNSTLKYEHEIEILLPSRKTIKVGINIRPHLKESLDWIKEKYNWVLYTASHQSYSDAVLNFIDPDHKYFKYRLYRHNCSETSTYVHNKLYIKDLDIIRSFNWKDIVIIDNSIMSFAYHLDNGIPIIPYYDSKEDSEWLILAYYLYSIAGVDDLRVANREHLQWDYYKKIAWNESNERRSTNDSNTNELLIEGEYYYNSSNELIKIIAQEIQDDDNDNDNNNNNVNNDNDNDNDNDEPSVHPKDTNKTIFDDNDNDNESSGDDQTTIYNKPMKCGRNIRIKTSIKDVIETWKRTNFS